MNQITSYVLFASLITFSALLAGPAKPCSPAPPSLHGPIVPSDGATGVPLNGRIVIATYLPPAVSEARLFGPDDEEGVLLTGRAEPYHVVFELSGAVLANTTYRVEFTSSDEEDAGLGEREPLTFTTGDADDDEAPQLLGEPTIEANALPGPFFSGPIASCDNPGREGWEVTVTVPEATDDVEVAGFRLLRVEDDGLAEIMVTLPSEGAELYDTRFVGGRHKYAVEAFDLAGNTVRSTDLEISLVPFLGGCSATDVSDARPPLFALLLLGTLALGLRRR